MPKMTYIEDGELDLLTDEEIPDDWIIALQESFDFVCMRCHDASCPVVQKRGMRGVVKNLPFWASEFNIIFHYYGFRNKYRIDGGEWQDSTGNHQELGDNDWYTFRKCVSALQPTPRQGLA